jgi:putative transposase
MQSNYITLVEKHIINSKEVYDITHDAKNLYNKALYIIRQSFIDKTNSKMIFYNELNGLMKDDELYKKLASSASQQILRKLDKNFKSFFKSIKDWSINPSKYSGRPKLPKYLDKDGHTSIYFPGQAFRSTKNGITIPKTKCKIKTKILKENLLEVRVVPICKNKVKIEIVYKKEIGKINLNKENSIGIDIGVNNLMAITSNQTIPIFSLINGRPLKSINQYYNKKSSKIKSELELKNKKKKSNKLDKLIQKRNNKIEDYLHKSSKKVIDLCIKNNIGTIIIGHNKGWKKGCNLGSRTNQNFIQIPFSKLINMIEYKSKIHQINVIINEESYTSKCDHIMLEEMKHREKYSGKRIKRGLFKSGSGIIINSDINGSIGILRKVKVVSDEWLSTLGNRGCVYQPVKITIK